MKSRLSERTFLVSLCFVSLALSGCSFSEESEDESSSSDEWREPGWMAEARQTQEEEASKIQTCLDEKGWDVEKTEDSSLSVPEGLNDEQKTLFFETIGDCSDEVLDDFENTDEAWQIKYDRALDTRDCLEDEGHKIPAPPSKDAWVKAGKGNQDLWTPFQFVIDKISSGELSMTESEFATLYDKCPQAGPTASMSFQ